GLGRSPWLNGATASSLDTEEKSARAGETAGHPHPGRSGASLHAEILVSGTSGTGEALVLTAPISFWGGVDPMTGRIADVRHPQHGQSVSGKVLFLPGTIGPSSASAVLLALPLNRR